MTGPDFRPRTKETLAKRAGQRCSNPACKRVTSGPHSEDDKSVNLGEAAHVKAARKGQARYDSEMTDTQRRHISNGIWLCRECARKIDLDEAKYSVDLLLGWKKEHEDSISGGDYSDTPISNPIVEDGYATLTLDYSATAKRYAKMSFLITNTGPRKCNIKKVELVGSIHIPDTNLVSIGRWPGRDVDSEGTQQLPLVIPIDEPIRVFVVTKRGCPIDS